MPGCVDLHMHTTASDGLHAPGELLKMVRAAGLTCFSVTDHDTCDGLLAIGGQLRDGDPQLLSGVELSISVQGDDMHMLAYGFSPSYPPFLQALGRFQTERRKRGEQIVDRLNQMGLPIPFSEVAKNANGAVIGRPHISDTLIRLGLARTTEEVFRKYIGYDGPAYVPKASWQPAEAIKLVHDAGGIAVMAHPFLSDMLRHLPLLLPLGLDGVEAYHYTHTRSQTERLLETARRNDLIVTGGSDFHGRAERDTGVGSQSVPESILEPMRARMARYQSKVTPPHA